MRVEIISQQSYGAFIIIQSKINKTTIIINLIRVNLSSVVVSFLNTPNKNF